MLHYLLKPDIEILNFFPPPKSDDFIKFLGEIWWLKTL
jgi:hypothetical protein